MKRQITRSETSALIESIRHQIPDITLRTTMLVGFLGETEEDFEELCDFVKNFRFDRLGVFMYSEEDTSAFSFQTNIPTEGRQPVKIDLWKFNGDLCRKNRGLIGKSSTIIDRKENRLGRKD